MFHPCYSSGGRSRLCAKHQSTAQKVQRGRKSGFVLPGDHSWRRSAATPGTQGRGSMPAWSYGCLHATPSAVSQPGTAGTWRTCWWVTSSQGALGTGSDAPCSPQMLWPQWTLKRPNEAAFMVPSSLEKDDQMLWFIPQNNERLLRISCLRDFFPW